VAATIGGALVGSVRALRPAAHGLIVASDWILAAFAKLLWYYPIMIGCLAIFIPARFGVRGLEVYGRTSLNLAIVATVWSAAMLLFVRATTRRTWPQIWKYFATVYVTGFGTGGSYDTLPVNLISAERDLGLRPQVARASIVLGTVLNKNVATMGVMLVTVSTCGLLGLPITMTEIAVLIPPVMILGLESPGIPGGAGVFMSPVIASLLAVPDPATFVTTFVTFYPASFPCLRPRATRPTTDSSARSSTIALPISDDDTRRSPGRIGEPLPIRTRRPFASSASSRPPPGCGCWSRRRPGWACRRCAGCRVCVPGRGDRSALLRYSLACGCRWAAATSNHWWTLWLTRDLPVTFLRKICA
jgi:hypothetical protein